jgi:hypothetical protein
LEREKIGLRAGTVERLAEFVRLLITNPQMRSEYALRARAYAMRQHSMRNADALADLIATCEHGNAVR